MNIMYAVKSMKGSIEIEAGGTVLMFDPNELEVVEMILCQLLQIVPVDCRPIIRDALNHVRVRHTTNEIQ
jgi:hypothetical protein